MAKKDYSTQGKSHPKSEYQSKSSKKKLTESDYVQNLADKLKEFVEYYADDALQEEKHLRVIAAIDILKKMDLSYKDLIILCAALKSDLDISRKQIEAIKVVLLTTAETGSSIEIIKQEKNETLLRKIRKKRAQ